MIYLFNIIFFIFHASLILKRIWIPIIQQCHKYDANMQINIDWLFWPSFSFDDISLFQLFMPIFSIIYRSEIYCS